MSDSRGVERTPRDEQQYRHSNPKDRGKSRYRTGYRPYPPHNSRRQLERQKLGPPPEPSESSRYSKGQPSHHSVSRKLEKKTKHSRHSYGADLQAEDRDGSSSLMDDEASRRVEPEESFVARTSDRPSDRKRKRNESPHYYDRHTHRHQRNPSPSRPRDFRYRDRGWRGRGQSDRHFYTKRSPSREGDFPQRFNPPKGPASSFAPRGRSPSPGFRRAVKSRYDRRRSRSRGSGRRSPALSSRHSVQSFDITDQQRSPSARPVDSPDLHNSLPDEVSSASRVTTSPPRRRQGLSPTSHHSMDEQPQGNTTASNPDIRNDGRFSRDPTRHYADHRPYAESPQYTAPSSRDASPQGRRGSWEASQQPTSHHATQSQYSPSYHQNTYTTSGGSHSQFHQAQHNQYSNHAHPSYSGQSHRGAHPPYRGGHYNQAQDRRFSASNVQAYAANAQQHGRREQFQSAPWMPAGHARGQQGPVSQPQAATAEDRMTLDNPELENQTFRASSNDRAMDDNQNTSSEHFDMKKMPPPSRQPNTGTPKEGKFSFAFKKATPSSAPKPVPDLAQRMRDPPRQNEPHKRQFRGQLALREKHRDHRRDERRDSRRYDRSQDRGRHDQRSGTASHRERHDGRLTDLMPNVEQPEHTKPRVKVILKKVKPRPTLTEEHARSGSVYFRKPGNESVIGAGTYGKVFKGVHVYTKQEVAMKKIRMEGEKDGFPITAVREIRLLQHLRHVNVVRLLEVMVEKNECFMVFEYLSHDLTGLINHPTFVLSTAHKKDLARQMFEGLRYLHNRGVLHRDIKAANILISNRGLLKLADFGLARFISKSRQMDYTNRVITIWYRPPELLLGETRYGPAVDIWGAACVWMEMFTKKAVFPGDGGEISQIDKLYTTLGTPTKSDWPDIFEMPWFELLRPNERRKRVFEDLYRSILSPAALELVTQMFQYDPAKRPCAEDVLNHAYFTSEDPTPQQAIELENCQGDWHEFESKAARREREKELKRAEFFREKEKRRVEGSRPGSDRETKKVKSDDGSSHPLPASHTSDPPQVQQ